MRQRLPSFALAAIAGATLFANVAAAQDWNPFDPFQNPTRGQADERQQPAREPPPPAGGDDIIRPLGDSAASAVERGDLKPVMAPDGSGLPYELWRGLDVGTLSRLITESISRHGRRPCTSCGCGS